MISLHLPLPLLNHTLYCLFFPDLPTPLQNCGLYKDRNYFILLAPWLSAHPGCILRKYRCVKDRVGDAIQASHQPDILYLHALHFARVPFKNITRLGGAREENGFPPEQHMAVNTSTIPIIKRACTVCFGKSTFSRPSIFFLFFIFVLIV